MQSEVGNEKIKNEIFTNAIKMQIRRQICENEVRCDGRGYNNLRPIYIDVNIFSKLHGSAFFQRGQSQVNNYLGKRIF